MARIYTRTGDAGKTHLWDGTQVDKSDPHIETNGTLDELNSALGLARSLGPSCMKEELNGLQSMMMTLMAYIARGKKAQPAPDPAVLEAWIDRTVAECPLENHFVNPGESPGGGALHLARSIARRAERAALKIVESGGDIEPAAYQYINRLSDLFFALAHKADMETKVEQVMREVIKMNAATETKGQKQLTLEMARRLMAEAVEKARTMGKAMVIAVCDASGELISLERMDGAYLVSLAHAQSKARSAVRIQMDTKDITPLAQPGAPFYGVQNEPEFFSIIGGGRLLRNEGGILGAVGISGGSVEEDLAVADAVVDLFGRI